MINKRKCTQNFPHAIYILCHTRVSPTELAASSSTEDLRIEGFLKTIE